ncbi:hypothetical protein [Amycolatopsis sp. 195334CR]|uniref:hypothetical protein n=1 Tax=Amycolatopsis sp. 195334CR TaxID=2814588 RepID=UPI001A8F6226|nr:hypothetical protein [Amycolatopsis sp. 195334CR]MBN6042289.1 hypothetical protein [Amycolatopsis sp. 195334CR]
MATMEIDLKIPDILTYLAEAGWARDQGDWRGPSAWRRPGDFEVLVPAHDGMGDGERRIRDILRCLSAAEDRPIEEIALEISRPNLDRLLIRTFPASHDAGYTSLVSGVQAVAGVRSLLRAATRAALQGPHYAFSGRAPKAVGDVLRAAELGPARPGSYVIEVRLATDVATRSQREDEVAGRTVIVHLLEAVSATHTAVLADSVEAFDELVTTGVSANLCDALSSFSARGRNEPFELTFRWARAQPREKSSDVLTFPPSSESLLLSAATRLRRLNASGSATVTGLISGLEDDSTNGDRWRIKIRGDLRTERTEEARWTTVWVRLADQATYDRAIAAHREQRRVIVSGELTSETGRVELVPGPQPEI